MYNIKITGGTIVDGSGQPQYKADIGIVGDQIAAIGCLIEQPAHQTIDATGMVVAPGFIDVHTHSDLAAIYDPHMAAHIHDGVTTDIIANCGIGTAPVTQKNRQLLLDYLGTRMIGSLPVKIELHWETMNEYLDYLRAHTPAGNIAPLVAQGSIRIAEMGFAMGKATPEQIKNMQRMVEEAMEAGALGISTGLAYLPGAYTEWEELREITKPVSKYNGLYISHMPLFPRILKTPYHYLYSIIILMCFVGVYSNGKVMFNVLMFLVFSLVGLFMAYAGLSTAPFALAYVLGGILETNLRRGLGYSSNGFLMFLERPVSACLLFIAVASLTWPWIKKLFSKKEPKEA